MLLNKQAVPEEVSDDGLQINLFFP